MPLSRVGLPSSCYLFLHRSTVLPIVSHDPSLHTYIADYLCSSPTLPPTKTTSYAILLESNYYRTSIFYHFYCWLFYGGAMNLLVHLWAFLSDFFRYLISVTCILLTPFHFSQVIAKFCNKWKIKINHGKTIGYTLH